jgi:hypothetical protein
MTAHESRPQVRKFFIPNELCSCHCSAPPLSCRAARSHPPSRPLRHCRVCAARSRYAVIPVTTGLTVWTGWLHRTRRRAPGFPFRHGGCPRDDSLPCLCRGQRPPRQGQDRPVAAVTGNRHGRRGPVPLPAVAAAQNSMMPNGPGACPPGSWLASPAVGLPTWPVLLAISLLPLSPAVIMTMRLRMSRIPVRRWSPAEKSSHLVFLRAHVATEAAVTAVETWGHHDGTGTGHHHRGPPGAPR